jgi:hypothetical protein
MTRTKAWCEWFKGKTPEEISKESGFSVPGICSMIAEVICKEYGSWEEVRKEARLRIWARSTEGRVRTMLARKQCDWEIETQLKIGWHTVRAVRSYLAPKHLQKRGPQVRGRKLAKLMACHKYGLGPTRAARICDVPTSTARSVYRRLDAGRPVDPGFCYIYHNDGTGLEEITHEN